MASQQQEYDDDGEISDSELMRICHEMEAKNSPPSQRSSSSVGLGPNDTLPYEDWPDAFVQLTEKAEISERKAKEKRDRRFEHFDEKVQEEAAAKKAKYSWVSPTNLLMFADVNEKHAAMDNTTKEAVAKIVSHMTDFLGKSGSSTSGLQQMQRLKQVVQAGVNKVNAARRTQGMEKLTFVINT